MRAIRRSSKQINLNGTEHAQPMIGQVGGVSIHKRPFLSLPPEYVLKPVRTDHRGLREIAFYEALEAVAKTPSSQTYSAFLNQCRNNKSYLVFLRQMREYFDAFAVACAIIFKDSVVVRSEEVLKSKRKKVQQEAEHLHTLSQHTPSYYGISGLESPSMKNQFGITEETHLVMNDLTANFNRPCVMDLKMGTSTYEPDAPSDKKMKELGKYDKQSVFGFRIVGMRVFHPNNRHVDELGYRSFGKEFGRKLETRDQMKRALKIFFGIDSGRNDNHHQSKVNGSATRNKTGKMKNGRCQVEFHVENKIRLEALRNILGKLRMIRRWFSENKCLLFCASSLLLVYEGDLCCETPHETTLKMIDFGRVRRNNPKGDPGYLHGLETIIILLMEILKDEEHNLYTDGHTPKLAMSMEDRLWLS